MFELVKRVIESNNLPTDEILDLCFAICTADKFEGTNRLSLSVENFLACKTEDKEWQQILELIGAVPDIQLHTINVQHYRVICDALVISCNKRGIKKGNLTSEASSIVANICGLNLRASEYLDINDVESVINELVSETYDFSEIEEIEKYLSEQDSYFKEYGFDLGSAIKGVMSGFKLPAKLRYIEEGTMQCNNEEEATEVYKERIIFRLEYEIVRFLREKFDKDPVRTNLFLNRAIKEVGTVGLGTVSMRNYAPTLEYESGLPQVIRVKLLRMFSRSMNYNYDDIDTVISILRNFYAGKIGMKYGI